ncbi:membrane protein [Streptomyces showdoensis]|uniref:Membrane protein n=1 Tax=Streptomyces showdoensis TaxID=68268 RepID=A0A2P2GJJ5_STREW|nr:membrane protein [Streptomyces showdoensis]
MIRAGARAGFVARGVLYLLVGVLAVRIGVTGSNEQADRGGALTEVAATPFGAGLLWALGAGLAGMAVWRLCEALFGSAGPKGGSAGKRALSGVRCVFYGVSSFLVLAFAAGDRGSGAGSTDRQSRDVTGRLLALPGGQWWVGAAAAGFVGAGLWIAGRAVLRAYRKHLAWGGMTKPQRRFMDVTGIGGGVGRGLVFGAVGYFGLRAAVTFDPKESKGMDDAIRSFAQTPVGPWLLVAVAVGLVLFGVFSFGQAKWRDV